MRHRLAGVALAVACLFTSAARAGPGDEPENRDILVVGTKLDDRVRDFVKALTGTPPNGQLARFEWKSCPVVIGLSERDERAVEERIRRVASSVGIPLDSDPNCRPNILVAVTKDRAKFVKDLSRQLPHLVPANGRETRALLAEPLATAWHLKGPPLNADGQPLQFARYQYVDPATGMVVRSNESVSVNSTSRQGSRITSSARLHFSAAVVLVDAGSLAGLSSTQLADYAAMRAFAETAPARLPSDAPASIVKVLDVPMGEAAPLSLTRWDQAFLRGLYRSRPNLRAASQQSEIGASIKAEIGEQAGQEIP